MTSPCLAFCEVLEQEYQEITGDLPDPPPDWVFTPEQILEPKRLARRLLDGHDRCARQLSEHQLSGLMTRLREPGATDDSAKLRVTLSEGLNEILDDPDLYTARSDHFRGVRFRSQTVDRLEGPVDQRNRLILEDTFIELQKLYDIRLARIYRKIHAQKLSALCLSGGGIRSATFALGLTQGLARNGLLDKFHYLSTVSGGGYLGGWLSAWIKHTNLQHVVEQLKHLPARPLEPEPTPIWHLRNYSNYLSPRLGLLSSDTWTLIATYLRNVFLNWLVLIPVMVGLLTVPLVLLAIVRWSPQGGGMDPQAWIGGVLTVLGVAGGALAVRYVHANRPRSLGKTEGTGLRGGNRDQSAFLRRGLLPLVLASVIGMVLWAWVSRRYGQPPLPALALIFAAIGALVHAAGWIAAPHPRDGGPTLASLFGLVREGLFVIATGAAAGAFLALLVSGAPTRLLNQARYGPEFYTWLGVPALLTLILIFSHIYAGYTSTSGGKQIDATREWSARFSAWLLIVIGGWLAVFGLVILGPIGMAWLQGNYESVIRAGKFVAGGIGVISGAFTLWKGYSANTPGKAEAGAPLGPALALATFTFVVLLVVLLAWVGRETVELARGLAGVPEEQYGPGSGVWLALGVAVLLFLFGLFSARFIDTNKFSLHAMYRARLIRAYLGASRPSGERDPNRFTGFDDEDNMHMRALWPRPGTRAFVCGRQPYHVVNAALNLVGGARLAWQQRKAESFTFGPLFCGSHNHGYRPTWSTTADDAPGYGGSRGLSLGTAITISGAAVSPNMGYHSSTIVSFLLTLFNVRLGWWLGNPGHAGRDVYQRSAPRSSLGLIADEALGHTDDRHPYVYLSDGGHFENLGLYEMVLRRCHTIVLSDGGCDPGATFEDLGNAVRKIRIDFGIPIEFKEPPFAIYAREGAGVAKPGKYCAIGSIKYGCVDDGAEDGVLLYLKPAFYGDEPKDVLNYARTSADFPHESTSDQFFSETQFESYRALGSHVIDQLLDGAPAADGNELAWLTASARQYASNRGNP